MASRKLDLITERVNEQNELDAKQLLKETQINTRIVDILNKNREELHIKTELRERRLQDGRIKNELMRLDKVKTPKAHRGNTVDRKMNTYLSQNYLINPKNKDNIFNYIDNLNYVLDKHNEYRYNYHKTMLDNMNFYNFYKDRYYANIYDKFYNKNNDKKWMYNDIIFFLNRAVNDELKEDKDYKEANKLDRYNDYLKNKKNDHVCYFQNFMNKHIDAKTKYNDYYLDKDELNKRHKIEENKKKKRDSKLKIMEDERRKRMQKILEKENNEFRDANKKEDIYQINRKNAQIETVKDKEYVENKAREVELRNDRIYKNQTVYKKGIYEMPYNNFL